jgi:hypothetical protein
MAEVDAQALDISLEGLKKVHAAVSLYITNKNDSQQESETPNSTFVSSCYATS